MRHRRRSIQIIIFTNSDVFFFCFFCHQSKDEPNYFGVICRDTSTNNSQNTYLCYVFKCESDSVVTEIIAGDVFFFSLVASFFGALARFLFFLIYSVTFLGGRASSLLLLFILFLVQNTLVIASSCPYGTSYTRVAHESGEVCEKIFVFSFCYSTRLRTDTE